MKNFLLLSLVAALAASGVAFGAPVYTTPVGYSTVTISPGVFNVAGLTLQQPVVASGILTGSSINSVFDTSAQFNTLLQSNVVYILEITNGSGEGVIQEVVNPPSATQINTPENISSYIVPNVTRYSLRKAATLNSILGSNNQVAHLKESATGDKAVADLVLIPNGDGTYKEYFYVRVPGVFEGWFDGTNPAGDVILNYADGFFVRTRSDSAADSFIVSGEVKPAATVSTLASNFNLISSVAPAGLTLATSGLSQYLAASTTGAKIGADLVVIPNPGNPGTFFEYYYVNVPGVFVGWFDGTNAANNVSLQGGFFIRNVGSPKSYKIAGPSIGS